MGGIRVQEAPDPLGEPPFDAVQPRVGNPVVLHHDGARRGELLDGPRRVGVEQPPRHSAVRNVTSPSSVV